MRMFADKRETWSSLYSSSQHSQYSMLQVAFKNYNRFKLFVSNVWLLWASASIQLGERLRLAAAETAGEKELATVVKQDRWGLVD